MRLNHLLDLDEVGHISFHQERANMFGTDCQTAMKIMIYFFSTLFELPTLKSIIIALQAEENTEFLYLPHPGLSPD